jgi:Domain of unknown function (DUF1918)
MMTPAQSDPQGQEPPSRSAGPLCAEVGDTFIMDEAGTGGQPRIGTIVAVITPDGSPPHVVRWLAGEYESTIYPGPGARIQKRG